MMSASDAEDISKVFTDRGDRSETEITSEDNFTMVALKEDELNKIREEYYEDGSDVFSDDLPPSYSVFVVSNTLKKSKDSRVKSSLKNAAIQDAPSERSPAADESETNCKTCEQKTKPDSVGKETWIQFTQNTSLHGIKYVFDESPFTFRRFMWLLCVLASFGLFGYQAIDRVCNYFHYSSYVNVQVVYGDTIEFPSVTICNYNKYRLTAVVDRGLYQFIDDIYRSEYLSGRPLPKLDRVEEDPIVLYDLDSQNLTAFLLATAHQKRDFIYNCFWIGEKCDVGRNFTTQFTDFGVCYTFNSNPFNRLYVNKSGSGFALSLTLNIEQYEYMSGPEHEAGIKALLHDPQEIPQVEDFGFAIAPGTHTLAGISRKMTDSLEAPYGTCVAGARPRSYCLAQCLAKQIESQCNCIDVYMDFTDNHTKVCDMAKAFFCMRTSLAMATRDMSVDCQCPGPCRKITYEPQLSYAQLSLANFDRMMLSDWAQKRRVMDNFARARNVAQMMNQDLVEKNNRLIETLINATRDLWLAVNESKTVLANDTFFLLRYGSSHELIDNFEMISDDFAAVNRSFIAKAAACLVAQPDLSDFSTMIYDIKTDFLDMESAGGGQSTLRQKILECYQLEQEDSSKDPQQSLCDQDLKVTTTEVTEPTDPYYACHETNRTYLFFRKMGLIKAKIAADRASEKVEDMDDAYSRTLLFVFGDTMVNYVNLTDHQKCITALENASILWLQRVNEFSTKQADAYLNASCWNEKLEALDDIEHFLTLTLGSESLLETPGFPSSIPGLRFSSCNWYLQNDWPQVLSDRSYGYFLSYSDAAVSVAIDSRALLRSLLVQAENFITELEETEKYLTTPLLRYLNSSSGMTKIELYKFFDSSLVSLTEESRRLAKQRYIDEWQQLLSQVSDVRSNAKIAFQFAFNFSIPALNTSLIKSLRLVNYSRTIFGHVQSMKYNNEDLDNFPSVVVPSLVEQIYSEYQQAMQIVQLRILQAFQTLETATEELKDELTDFSENSQLNEQFLKDNFIKVDIFYKDLSYEKISLQVSFELMSLFSEIGGLLGLLLGASILTVFELLDFIILLAARNVRNCHRHGDGK